MCLIRVGAKLCRDTGPPGLNLVTPGVERERDGCNSGNEQLKGIVHPKMKILSSFTHPRVVPNLYEFLCSAEHKGRYLKKVCNQAVLGHH